MSSRLTLAIPSKGRLKDQVEAWLADCGLTLVPSAGARGYQARIAGLDDVQVRLASATDIAAALIAGEVHLGVTGEDLLRETGDALGDKVLTPLPLGFGRADLVVAAPRSWIDVETMADLDDVARLYLARTGARLRVATKYRVQTRAFFARHGVADYRIVDSAGATEGAPAAATAELVVDISSSGATLAANGLKPISDGVILNSQAHLSASLVCSWTAAQAASAVQLVRIVEARARGKAYASLAWPTDQEKTATTVLAALTGDENETGLLPIDSMFAAIEALSAAKVGPVTVMRPAFIVDAVSGAADQLMAALTIKGLL
jgi:ATP phosphoribosyltransferase